jgi:myosin V
MRSSKKPSYMHIDLLDIFGFESFKRNSFEQFCINFANEKLQQKFTLDVFKTVQEEYTKEQVGWEFVKFKDNQDMLDLLENSMGLMALLNEECVRPMGSDVSFASKIASLHDSHPRLEKIRVSQTQFLLHHYAGPVTYDAEGFVEKNRDSLQSDLLDLLCKSSNGLIAGIFGARASGLYTDDDLAAVFAAATSDDGRRSATGRKTSTFMQETVSYKFKAQLALLMSDISATEVHYVRCIKPNSKKSPHSYEIDAVVSQLRCAGVIEAIRITRAAFPNKLSHEKFLRRFVLMKDGSEETVSESTAAAACEKLVQKLLGNEFKRADKDDKTPLYVVGKTLVYFGKDVLEYLEQRRTVFVHDCAVKIQRCALRWYSRKRMAKIRKMIVTLQAIQKRKVARRKFVETRRQCIKIQSLWRGVRSRNRAAFLLRYKMATRLQAGYRAYKARQRFTRFRDAVIKIQAQQKMRKQVDKYQQLLKEKQEHTIMETEVALLKRRLDEEKRARSEIEVVNTNLQKELFVVRQSSTTLSDGDLNAPPHGQPAITKSRLHNEKDGSTFQEESKLLDDSERMIDYLKKEVTKGRDLIVALTQENENLKIENKKVKDAYAAAGASFAALNQHNKQQSKANLRLMSTHAALIKSQEEKMKKYQKQIADLKEDLKMQRSVYSAELMARVQQQDLLVEMVRLSESFSVPDELLEKMKSMIENSKPLYNNGSGKPPLGRLE